MKETNYLGQAKWITHTNKENENIVNDGNPFRIKPSREVQFQPIEDKHGLALFRKTFKINGLKTATVKATAMGVFDLYCNGERVGREENGHTVYDEMKPGWTQYGKRVMFYTYDITKYLKDGENTLFAAVAPGWYNGRISFATYGETHVSFIADIEVTDADGKHNIPTDTTWETLWGGQVRASDIWDGELFDANYTSYKDYSSRKDKEQWNTPIAEERDILITPNIGPTVNTRAGLTQTPKTVTIYNGTEDNNTDYGKIHIIKSLKSTANFTLKAGEVALIDLEQEIVGRPSFKVKGKKGTKVTVRVGEMLNDSGEISRGNDGPEGSIYSINYRTAKAKAYYILNGEKDFQHYCPIFTFFGFRYIELSSTEDVEFSNIEFPVLGSEIKETGTIETSNKEVNKLISNILWGQRGNYLSVPTDCPQRDERLGWTGDTQAFCRTASYNAEVKDFFHKWLQDARDSQNEEGMYPDVIPNVSRIGWGGAAWSDAGIIVPYTIWQMFADTDIISEHYTSMEKYMSWLKTTDFKGPKPTYGDWLAYEPTDKNYICLAYYALDCMYMSEMSRAINKPDRAEYYENLYKEIRTVFQSRYIDKDGNLNPEHRTQTGYLLALKMKMFDSENIPTAVKALKQKIIDNGYKLSTGFVGSCIINEILAENGENNLAYSLLLQTEDPSWLYSVRQGATTVWERWNSYTKAKGFGDVGMNSFNHYAYGSVQSWMYAHIAGIQPQTPGFKTITLAPKPDTRTETELPKDQTRITYANTTYNSQSGKIVSNWNNETNFRYYTEVPTETTLYLPILTIEKTFKMNGEVKNFNDYELTEDNKTAIIPLKSGKYLFEE